MKPSVLFTCSLLFTATSALAAPDPNSCVPGSMQLKAAERDAYVESCMAQVSSPANVQESFLQSKLSFCEQNVKNMKLRGTDRSNYIGTCINSNEAEAAAKEVAAQQAAAGKANAAKLAATLQNDKCACPTAEHSASSVQKPAMRKKVTSVTCKKPNGKKAKRETRRQTASSSSKT